MNATALVRRTIDPRVVPRRAVAAVAVFFGVLVAAGGAVAGEPVAGLLVGAAGGGTVAWLAHYLLREEVDAREEARELWSLTGLMLDGKPWPVPGGWALSPAALGRLLREMDTRDCHTVVELGPGTSSIVVGRARPDVHITGLEHDLEFVDVMRASLRQHGLARYDLIHAPLVEQSICGSDVRWYDPAAVERLPPRIDVLVVDGPPNGAGAGARFPAWPTLRERMRAGGLVLVDDTDRPDERRMVGAWTEDGSLRVLADVGSFALLEVCPPSETGG